MSKHFLSTNYNNHDQASKMLFETKSLDALKFLIANGRELEFVYDGAACFLSRSSSSQDVSLWCDGIQQSFDSMDALIENAVLNQTPFSDAWEKAELSFLF